MNQKEKVSIIIPVYNAEFTIDKTLKSVLSQTYHNLEIIVINDGSIDKTDEVLNAYKADERIKYLKHENRGVSYTRNRGVKEASGKYIVFLDSDDELPYNAINVLVKKIMQDNVVFVSGGYQINESKGNYIILPRQDVYQDLNKFREKKIYSNLINNKILLSVWCKIYDRSFLIDNNITFDESFQIGEDMQFMQTILLSKISFSLISEAVYIYNIETENSITKESSCKRIDNGIKLLNKTINFADELCLEPEEYEEFYKYYFRTCFVTMEKAKNDLNLYSIYNYIIQETCKMNIFNNNFYDKENKLYALVLQKKNKVLLKAVLISRKKLKNLYHKFFKK